MSGPTLILDHTTLVLPWPPSVNRYYRHVGNRTVLSRDGRAYRANALASITEQGSPRYGKARVSIHAIACAPDKRPRDLDNLWKAVGDALEYARVIDNDSQIDDQRITRGDPEKPGRIQITIREARTTTHKALQPPA